MPRKPKPPPNLDRLRELLDYNPDSGVFVWKVDRGTRATCGGDMFRVAAGSVAGGLTTNGYITIRIDRSPYLAHRLAWYYVHGDWPDEIDHRDRNRINNAIANLNPVSHKHNCHNITRAPGRSGFRGVVRKFNKWRAYISSDGKSMHLGYFNTAEEASAAYQRAKAKLHYVP